MKTPSCSVVMPLFNKEQDVRAAILSVLNQTFRGFELIVVNDGSTDSSVGIVEEFKDDRISLVNQENAGVSAARNKGIKFARSELIAFIDADDLWHPDFLATVIALREDFPEAKWFATGYEILHPETGRSFSELNGEAESFRRGILGDYFKVATNSAPPVWSSAVAVTRDAMNAVGGFPLGIGSGEDLLTWARLAVRFPLAYEVRSLAVFRVSGIHRRADPTNQVGQALQELAVRFPLERSLKTYLGMWYRMQAVMAMRFGDHALARQRAWLAMRHGPTQLRNLYTLALTMLPAAWRAALDAWLRSLLGRQKDKPAR